MTKTVSKKEVTCGVIIIRDIDSVRSLFMAHSTGNKFWDIPKGVGEVSESAIQTAIRELDEETGFKVTKCELTDLGIFSYNSKKDMHLFWYRGDQVFEANQAFCTSFFKCPFSGKERPEADDFAYVPFDGVRDRCAKSFIKVFTRLERELAR